MQLVFLEKARNLGDELIIPRLLQLRLDKS